MIDHLRRTPCQCSREELAIILAASESLWRRRRRGGGEAVMTGKAAVRGLNWSRSAGWMVLRPGTGSRDERGDGIFELALFPTS